MANDSIIEEQDFKNTEPIQGEPEDEAVVNTEPKPMESGHYENGVKVRGLTKEEIAEIGLDHLKADEFDRVEPEGNYSLHEE